MTVERMRLGDVLELQRTPVVLEPGEEYQRIGIYSWGRGTLHREPVPAHEMGSLRYFRVPARALLVSNIQAWEGALAVTDESDAACVASNRFFSYLPRRPDLVAAEYLLHYLLSEAGFPRVQQASPGTQVRNRTLKIPKFEQIDVPLPDVEHQLRIVDRLRSVIDVQAKARRHQVLVDALLPAARNEAFGRFC